MDDDKRAAGRQEHQSSRLIDVFIALSDLSLPERVHVLQLFCPRCGTREDEGLRPLMRGNRCPCDPTFDC